MTEQVLAMRQKCSNITHLISCAKLAGLPKRRKSHSNNSAAVERDSTLTQRHKLRKFFSAGLIFSGCLSLGVPFVAMR